MIECNMGRMGSSIGSWLPRLPPIFVPAGRDGRHSTEILARRPAGRHGVGEAVVTLCCQGSTAPALIVHGPRGAAPRPRPLCRSGTTH